MREIIKKLVESNKIKEVFDILEKQMERLDNDNLSHTISVLKSQFDSYEKDRIINAENKADFTKLKLRILEVCDSYFESDTKKVTDENNATSKKEKLHDIILRKYFKNSQYNIDRYDKHASKDFSHFFWNFLTVDTKYKLKDKFQIANDEIIDFLTDQIIESESAFPVLVKGYTGTGKSLLLGLIYTDLYQKSQNNNSYCPIYINLHYYEYYVYNTNNIINSARKRLGEDLDELLNCEEVAGKKLILIIDGADEYIKPKVDLYDEVRLQIEKFDKKIVGVRKFKEEELTRKLPISGKPDIEIGLTSVLTENNKDLIHNIFIFLL